MKKNNKIIYSLLIVFLLKFTTQQASDESFDDFCEKVGGKTKKTTELTVQTVGDKCIGANFGGQMVDSKEEADEFCMKFGPFHFLESRIDAGYLKCDYESLIVCRVGYKQIRGRCYRIANGLRSVLFKEAEEKCQETKDQLYFHYSDEIGHFIRLFFRGLSAIWTKIPETTILDVAHVEGGKNFAVLYGTANVYGVGEVSLAKIPDNHFAMVMCEYTPEETFLSLMAKMKKFEPYMPKMKIDNRYWLWRTFSYYHTKDSNIHGTRYEEHQNECKKSLSVFLPSTKHVKLFDTTKDNMKTVGNELKDHTIFLAPFRHCSNYWCSVAYPWDGTANSCWENPPKRNFFNGVYQGCSASCDTNKRAIMMLYKPGGQYEFFFTHRRPAPMLCDVRWEAYEKKNADCPSGWTTFDRIKDGTRACHLRVTALKQRDDARDYCYKTHGAYLAGWRSVEELNIIRNFGLGWVSIRRDELCPEDVEIVGHQCHMDNIFFDPDGMSDNSLEGRRIHAAGVCRDQPSNTGKFEYCMAFAYGNCMHDYNCDTLFPFTCTKIAAKVEKG